jgi:hypothetical protein
MILDDHALAILAAIDARRSAWRRHQRERRLRSRPPLPCGRPRSATTCRAAYQRAWAAAKAARLRATKPYTEKHDPDHTTATQRHERP